MKNLANKLNLPPLILTLWPSVRVLYWRPIHGINFWFPKDKTIQAKYEFPLQGENLYSLFFLLWIWAKLFSCFSYLLVLLYSCPWLDYYMMNAESRYTSRVSIRRTRFSGWRSQRQHLLWCSGKRSMPSCVVFVFRWMLAQSSLSRLFSPACIGRARYLTISQTFWRSKCRQWICSNFGS